MPVDFVTNQEIILAARIDQLNAAYLCPVQPLGSPHEMSAFVHMPGGQLL